MVTRLLGIHELTPEYPTFGGLAARQWGEDKQDSCQTRYHKKLFLKQDVVSNTIVTVFYIVYYDETCYLCFHIMDHQCDNSMVAAPMDINSFWKGQLEQLN